MSGEGRIEAACGYLLSRGISGAARSVGWSMAVMVGSQKSCLYGLLLFCVTCALVCLVRECFDNGVNVVVSRMLIAVTAIWTATSGADGGRRFLDFAMCAAMMLAMRVLEEGVSVRIHVSAAVIILAMSVFPSTEPTGLALRINALCGALASAGMCGAAIMALHRNRIENWAATMAGIAAGLV